MNVLSLPQPLAQLCVTHQSDAIGPTHVCEFLYPGEEAPPCPGQPMVKRMVVLPDPCPENLVGSRVALAATDDHLCDGSGSCTSPLHIHGCYTDKCEGREDHGLPFGVIVGSATLGACYPIMHHDDWGGRSAVLVDVPHQPGLWLTVDERCPACDGVGETINDVVVGGRTTTTHRRCLKCGGSGCSPHARFADNLGEAVDFLIDVSDQLAYDTFSPGQHAWMLTDAAPTSKCCPRCWGRGRFEPRRSTDWTICPVCQGQRRCEPVPWTSPGGTGLAEWTPWNPT